MVFITHCADCPGPIVLAIFLKSTLCRLFQADCSDDGLWLKNCFESRALLLKWRDYRSRKNGNQMEKYFLDRGSRGKPALENLQPAYQKTRSNFQDSFQMIIDMRSCLLVCRLAPQSPCPLNTFPFSPIHRLPRSLRLGGGVHYTRLTFQGGRGYYIR